jgi:hypothetical protein
VRPLAVSALPSDDPLTGDDTQLALQLLYGLHYEGFEGVDPEWEWEPTLLALRNRIERRFVDALIADVGSPSPVAPAEVPDALRALIAAADGPSLSSFVLEQGTIDHLREFMIHRSIYQRREADAHTWGIPRLRGRAKSAMVTIQADEYGNGVAGRTHAELFATTMTVAGLDPTPGAYLDAVPGVTLATDNLVSLLGLHRRWRGALVGHLAVFEMTSVVPMGRYAAALRRVGLGAGAEFYDVHVEADAEHEIIAAEQLARGLADDEPGLIGDLLFGAAAVMAVERRLAEHLLDRWHQHRTSLREETLTRTA